MDIIVSDFMGDNDEENTTNTKNSRSDIISTLISLCTVENVSIPHEGEYINKVEGGIIRKEKTNENYKNGLIGRAYYGINEEQTAVYNVGWVLDDAFNDCMVCEEEFAFLSRNRHHCRACGNLVCDECSLHRIVIPQLKGDRSEARGSRVCDVCSATKM
mmetsp:Transcript_24851/g.42068  ORF Transcript_24851/g.42068 Transcript_24851/m.42068 type:complete len:159 (-) Transcript_24851:1122-1598(-)